MRGRDLSCWLGPVLCPHLWSSSLCIICLEANLVMITHMGLLSPLHRDLVACVLVPCLISMVHQCRSLGATRLRASLCLSQRVRVLFLRSQRMCCLSTEQPLAESQLELVRSRIWVGSAGIP